MGELLPGLWLAEVDLLISLCANYPDLSWKKVKINDWHYAFKQKISRLAMQGCLTVNYPPHSLLWSIGHSQISMPKFCLDNHSSNNKIFHVYEKQTNQHPISPVWKQMSLNLPTSIQMEKPWFYLQYTNHRETNWHGSNLRYWIANELGLPMTKLSFKWTLHRKGTWAEFLWKVPFGWAS